MPQFNPNDDLKQHLAAPSHRTAWFLGTLAAILLLGLTSWTATRDDHARALERRADAERKLIEFGCPPKRAGDTDLIVLLVETTADPHTNAPLKVTGCSRYVERSWMKRNRIAEVKP